MSKQWCTGLTLPKYITDTIDELLVRITAATAVEPIHATNREPFLALTTWQHAVSSSQKNRLRTVVQYIAFRTLPSITMSGRLAVSDSGIISYNSIPRDGLRELAISLISRTTMPDHAVMNDFAIPLARLVDVHNRDDVLQILGNTLTFVPTGIAIGELGRHGNVTSVSERALHHPPF